LDGDDEEDLSSIGGTPSKKAKKSADEEGEEVMKKVKAEPEDDVHRAFPSQEDAQEDAEFAFE
jgi:hypothetical protein